MRKLIPFLLIFALLAGCKQADTPVDNVSPSPTAAVTPSSTPTATPSAEATPTPTPEPTPEPTPTPEPIRSTLTLTGDVISHLSVIYGAGRYEDGQYDFRPMMHYVKPWIEQADYAITNLETTFAGPPDYSGYPYFNGPDSIGLGLKDAGFDLVNTTNNHSLDRNFEGLCRTLDVLDQQGLAHIGTYRTQEERDANHGIVVADCGGISIAFLSYSYGTNAHPVPAGKDWCINLFNSDYMTDLSVPYMARLREDMAYAKTLNCDLIAVIMHWGVEYRKTPTNYQVEMAHTMVDLGADLVLGGHPHVLQPYEFITTQAGNSGFVCYSVGNFLSNQDFDDTNCTVLLNLELKKDPVTGEATLDSVNYVPCFMVNPGIDLLKKPVVLLDVYAAMKEYESGDKSLVTDEIYGQLQHCLQVCHEILGVEGDLQAQKTE